MDQSFLFPLKNLPHNAADLSSSWKQLVSLNKAVRVSAAPVFSQFGATQTAIAVGVDALCLCWMLQRSTLRRAAWRAQVGMLVMITQLPGARPGAAPPLRKFVLNILQQPLCFISALSSIPLSSRRTSGPSAGI